MLRLAVLRGRWRHAAFALAVLVVGAGAVLAITSAAGHGEITGHVYHCDSGWPSAAAKACAPGEPVGPLTLHFAQVDGSNAYTVSTDSNGAYSVSVVPGTYVVNWEIVAPVGHSNAGRVYTGDWGLKPVAVKSGQHLVLNLTGRSLTL
mgnify:CR=1 FL=1